MHQTAPSPHAGDSRIQDYGIIGDSRAAALVSTHGSMDWLCWPRFDSPAIFAALLDPKVGGHWRILPLQADRVERRYVEETNILETRFHCASGTAVATDLMPVASEEYKRGVLLPDHEILRQIECTQGEVQVEFDFRPRADYGQESVQMREAGKLGLRMEVGTGVLWLRSSIPLVLHGDSASVVAHLRPGETLQFSLTYAEEAPAVLPPLGKWIQEAIGRSVAWWQQWARRAKYEGPYRAAVVRSALALKLLTYAPSGAIVAAATSSLPERLGADLNWDYRYCWLRDASLTMRVLLGLGYREEADAFLGWLLETTGLTQPELRILYTVYGEATTSEHQLDYLCGYAKSRPVRVGNAAWNQLQLDVCGEVVDAAAQCVYDGAIIDRDMQRVLVDIGEYVARNWQRPDEGIWEPRNGRQHHTHSRVLCWTALDRIVRLSEKGVLRTVRQDDFQLIREQIAREVKERAWNKRLRSYVSVLDGGEVDASLLQLSWYGFEEAGSERMKETYRLIRERLRAGRNLLYRYLTNPPEGAFGLCSFWEVEYMALGGGTLDEAHSLFRQLLSYANDLGLFAEEIDPETGEPLGNFPQAFTHVGLISAALTIQQQEEGQPHLHPGSNTNIRSDTQRRFR
jgi:GH15 family glucan-1,4-alpha-glucosidase